MIDTDVLVVGAGQAGLAASHELAERGIDHVVVDSGDAPGEAWRNRWDSLRLFTPARFDGLPGMPFPAGSRSLPTAGEFADYLGAYAERFSLPVHPRTSIRRLTAAPGGGFTAATDDATAHAHRVVVATGGETSPFVPSVGHRLDARIRQLHTCDYRRPDDVPAGRVLVVGCGTSGVQLGIELARAGRQVTVAGTPTMQVPKTLLAVAGGAWFTFLHHVLTRATPIGRRAAPRAIAHGAPLIGIGPHDLDRAGAGRGPRLTATVDGLPQLADGRVIETDSVLWATGYSPDFSWIDGLHVDEHGLPAHERGVSTDISGLAFLGLPFQFAVTSGLIGGAARDSAHVVSSWSGPG